MKTATMIDGRRGASTGVVPREGGTGMSDLRDLYSDPDTLFVVGVISEAMQRGVRHFKLDGTPLGRLNEIIDALAQDGEVLMDAEGSRSCPRH
jgi:hypothetical protein